MIPKKIRRKNDVFEIVKIYDDFILYKNEKTGARECFTKYQLGIQEEMVKPEKQGSKGGMCKC